ncbi:MAG: non-homologous end-joining DNA ligase [Candidatus Hadarchaeales archaeon]
MSGCTAKQSTDTSERWVEVEGRRLKLTRLEKQLWPGITKAELIKYYAEMSDFILPYLRSRPMTLHLYPDGIEGKHFFRKEAPEFTPDWVRRFPYRAEDGKLINYILCGDRPTLIWLANLANIEFPITLSRIEDLEHPDLVVFDLDPFQPATFRDACMVALVLRDGLRQLGLQSWVKTSGATGLHVLVPVAPKYTFQQTREFVRRLGKMLESLMPEVLAEFRPVEERKGRVLIDFGQNSPGKTITAPYSLKPLPSAPVSTPLDWTELEKELDPREFNMHNILERVKGRGDILKPVLETPQTLDRAFEALGMS